jgi:hypothetical protein
LKFKKWKKVEKFIPIPLNDTTAFLGKPSVEKANKIAQSVGQIEE